jgi:acyl-CoA thioesterase FadM
VADGFDKLGFDIFYKLEINVDGKKVLVGKAKTGMMCFNYAQKKRVTIPEEAITKLTA